VKENKMEKTARFDRNEIRMIRDAMQKALEKVTELYGVEFKVGNISFSDLTFKAKIDAAIVDKAAGQNLEQVEFTNNCWLAGYKPTDYGKKLIMRGRNFRQIPVTLVGVKSGRSKYPIVVRDNLGRLWKASKVSLTEAK
jgi:hypothetical protein